MEKDNVIYSINFVHTAETLKLLSRAQYDLFCKSNFYIKLVLSIVLIFVSINILDKWYGPLILLYGIYLLLSKYMQSDYTSRKLVRTIEESDKPFPASRYDFFDDRMEIYRLDDGSNSLTDTLYYKNVKGIYDDLVNYYIFRDQYGGYVIPKSFLLNKEDEFRNFLELRTHKDVKSKLPPVVKLIRKLSKNKK